MAVRHLKAKLLAAAVITLTACTIEPPLKLADGADVEFAYPEVVTDINLIWGLDSTWTDLWWYGWDAEDAAVLGELEYPTPATYQARIYFYGALATNERMGITSARVVGSRFVRRYAYGWYDMLLWSEIASGDGTQVLIFDKTDPDRIIASTSTSRLGYFQNSSRTSVHNNPEIFYAGSPEMFYVSDDPADYDYYDEERHVYVKEVDAFLSPLVYTYLVQVVLYNNNGRITSLADESGMTALADGVVVNTGHTTSSDIVIGYPMRFKHDLPTRAGRLADIFGGRFTTFGLCDMEPWVRSRGTRYDGSMGQLQNLAMVNFQFANSSDSVYIFNVTDQMQRQAHGGIVTIEIDVDTLKIPNPGTTSQGGGFNPYIAPGDSIDHEYEI